MGIREDIHSARCDERIAVWTQLKLVSDRQEFCQRWIDSYVRERDATKVWAVGDEVEYDAPGHAYHGRKGFIQSVIDMGGGPWDWVVVKEYGTNEAFGAPMWELKEDDQ